MYTIIYAELGNPLVCDPSGSVIYPADARWDAFVQWNALQVTPLDYTKKGAVKAQTLANAIESGGRLTVSFSTMTQNEKDFYAVLKYLNEQLF